MAEDTSRREPVSQEWSSAALPATPDEVLERWRAAVASGNPGQVAGLYHPRAVLWGTISTFLRDTPGLIRDYFDHFLEGKHDAKVTVFQQVRRPIGRNGEVQSGTYTFAWTDDAQKHHLVYARYSFVFVREKDGWWILDHHSSRLPES